MLLAACEPAGGATRPAPATTRTAGAGSATAAAEGATLRWAISPPSSIVPATAVDDAGLLVVDSLFDSLTTLADDGTVRASAAVRWTPDDDATTWTFALRPDMRFHDGTPVTATAFADAWARAVAGGQIGPHLLHVAGYRAVRDGRTDRLAGVRVVDDRTLAVTLTRADHTFPAAVAHPSLGPMPPGAALDDPAFAMQPIGNGPFAMAEPWVPGQFIRVTRDEAWRNGPAEQTGERVSEIVFRIIDADAAYIGFQQGRIDVAPVPAGALAQARRTYGVRTSDEEGGLVEDPLPSLYYLGLRVDRPPLDDPAVRQAFSRAIDRDTIVASLRDRRLDVARAITPQPLLGAGRARCDACLHLPSLAAATFAAAEVTELTLTYDANAGHDPIMRMIQRDLRAVGVTVTLQPLPFEEYLAALAAGEPTVHRFGWQAQSPEAGAMLEAVVAGGAPAERGDSANYTGYASERVDALLAEARATADLDDRLDLWARAEAVALEDLPVVPLFGFRQRLVVGEGVEHLTLTPWGTATPEQARLVAEPDIAP